MKNTNKKFARYHGKLGFTLVELIIVIAVIGVLAAILIPTFANVIDKANAKSALSDAKNIATKYVTSKLDDDTTGGSKHMPEEIVIVVKKAKKYYVFGYSTEGTGELQVSDANGQIESENLNDLVTDWSWNSKHSDAEPNQASYDLDTDGAFYLVPKPVVTPIVKAFTKEVPSAELTAKYNFQEENIEGGNFKDANVVEGYLLPGTFVGESEYNSGGTGEGGEGGTTPTPPPAPQYNVTFNHVSTAAGDTDFDASKISGASSATTTSPFIAASHTFTYNKAAGDRIWYTLNGMYIGGEEVTSKVITGDITVEVRWDKEELDQYTLTFAEPTGVTLNLASGVSATMTLDEGTVIGGFLNDSTATKAHATFKGWTDGEGNTYAPGLAPSNLTLTKNKTYTPLFDDVTYTVTYKSGSDEYVDMLAYNAGDTITLLPFATTGFTAPANKEFSRWVVNSIEYAPGTVLPDACSGDVIVTAKYVAQTFGVRYQSTSNVTVPAGTETFDLGTHETYTISGVTADNWYHIAGYTAVGTKGTPFTVVSGTINTSAVQAGEDIVITPNADANVANFTFTDGGSQANITNYALAANSGAMTLSDPTKDGYTFAGWTVTSGNATVSGNVITVTDKATATVNVAVTANWEEEVTGTFAITYIAPDSTNPAKMPENVASIESGSDYTIPANKRPECIPAGASMTSNTAKSFISWSGSDGNTYLPGDTIKNITSSITLTATWVNNCYAIRTWADVAAIDSTAKMTYSYVVAANITKSDFYGNVIGWLAADTPFTGTVFDGNGYTFTLDGEIAGADGGLFALNESKLRYINMNVNFGDYGNGVKNCGALVGRNQSTGTIDHCNITIRTMAGAILIGGVAGRNYGDIHDCHINVTGRMYTYSCSTDLSINGDSVSGTYLGGITGANFPGATIRNCSVKTPTTGSSGAGIDGYSGSQSSSTATGATGGIAGVSSGTIENCFIHGQINTQWNAGYGGWAIGGIIGYGDGDSVIRNCWAYLAYINGYDCIGGIAGECYGTIDSCYAFTNDAGCYTLNYLASIVSNAMSATVTNCYYEYDIFKDAGCSTFGTYKSSGLLGGDSSYFAGFDSNIWSFESGYSPSLKTNPGHYNSEGAFSN